MNLHHLTLNTGDLKIHRLDMLAPAAVQACAGQLSGGSLPPPFSAHNVHVTLAPGGGVLTLYRAHDPILTCGVACTPDGSADVWSAMAGMAAQFVFRQLPKIPPLPWCVVLLLPGIVLQSRDDIGWMGDWERCMAAAIIRRDRGET